MIDSKSLVGRLENRLSKLSDTASEESIQALAKWIGFRRKHAKDFASSLTMAIVNPAGIGALMNSDKSVRQWLYLQVVHETIILDSGTSRWDRLGQNREVLGEYCVVEVAKRGCLDAATVKRLEGLVKQWESLNVFPTFLINMIKKQLASPTSKDQQVPKEAATGGPSLLTKSEKAQPDNSKRKRSTSPAPAVKQERATPSSTVSSGRTATKAKAIEESPSTSQAKSPKKDFEYDFESKDIPYGKVDSKDFLAPCKAIATLQIARDLRNDSAVQLASLLKALPEDLKSLCEEADKEVKSSGTCYVVPDEKAREMSLRTSETLLDMDLEDQLQNVRTFAEIIQKQREARELLIRLLIRSRCRFGANETAEAFYNLDDTMKELQRRKDTLLDAMALEGLDFEETKGGPDKGREKETVLPPLAWYKKGSSDDTGGDPVAKRAKLEE